MSFYVINPYQTFYDSNGIPRAGGFVTFFVNTTSTKGSIYSDEALTVAQANPYELDASGRMIGDVKYSGLMTMQVTNSDGSDVTTTDNVSTVETSDLLRADLAASGGSDLVGFLQSGTEAVARTVQDKERDTVSVFDFMTAAEIADVRANTALVDVTVAIQAAVDASVEVDFPVGTYLISDTIRESTNSGRRHLIGENKNSVIFQAASGLDNKPFVWFGNSNGHGNYRCKISGITFDGVAKANGVIGIRLHECGTSELSQFDVDDCDIAVQGLGVIHTIIRGMGEISTCNNGVILTALANGTPADVDDITVTAGPLGLKPNQTMIEGLWFNSVYTVGVQVEGGLVKITNNTFQSCGNSTTSKPVYLINANESYDYGGGPLVSGNWFEGGTYSFCVYVDTTRAAKITGNFFSGNTTNTEGGVLLKTSKDCSVTENSFRGTFSATPTESRAGNGAVYLTADCGYNTHIFNNYYTKNTTTPYYAGETLPAEIKPLLPIAFVAVTISAGVPTITNSYNISSVTRSALGSWRIHTAFNKDPTTDSPSYLTQTGATILLFTRAAAIATYDQFDFIDDAGSAADPTGFCYMLYSTPTTFA